MNPKEMTPQEMEGQVETEEASPEEEAQYEQALESSLTALHSGEVAKNTVGRVINAKTTADGVAEAVFVLLRRAEVSLDGLEDSVKVQLCEDLAAEILGLMVESERLQESEIDDVMIEKIVQAIYVMYVEDAESRGGVDTQAIQEDVALAGPQKPQGSSAMSNQEVQERGLMDV